MYVNIITGSLIQKIATAHLLSARYFPEQGGSARRAYLQFLSLENPFVLFSSRVKNLIQKKILLCRANWIDETSCLFSVLDCLHK